MFYLTTHSIYSYMALTYGKGMKEMFYLMTHSTHFIYSYMAIEHMIKEGRKCFI